MRTFDFAPLHRATVGFDQMADLMDRVFANDVSQPSYPPYNIERRGENEYRITMAVAGFSQDELTITHEPNLLVVMGDKADDSEGEYLHRGIANRAFMRRFDLADHVKVGGANLSNGMLTIDLKRELPEAMKPRRIAISSGTEQAQIESGHTETEKLAA